MLICQTRGIRGSKSHRLETQAQACYFRCLCRGEEGGPLEAKLSIGNRATSPLLGVCLISPPRQLREPARGLGAAGDASSLGRHCRLPGGVKGSLEAGALWAKGAGAQQVSSCEAQHPHALNPCPQHLARWCHPQQAPSLEGSLLLLTPHAL